LLWSYQRVFFGEITKEKNRTLPDASAREKWILVTMAVVTLWMGIGSVFITRRTAADAQVVIDQVEPRRPYDAAAPAGPAQQAVGIAPGIANTNSVQRPGTR
jgi:NADH:ubiquinone oxidoreductase subunit 4 (subunit M)